MALTVARKMRYGFMIAFTALLLGGVATLYTTARLRRTNDQLLRTQKVLEHLGIVLTLIVDEESGGRGFALTGRDEFLEPLQRAWERLPEEFTTLRELTADDPDQQARVEQLRALAEQRAERSEEIIRTRRAHGLEATAALFADGGGKVITDHVRTLIEKMDRAETELLLARTHADQKVARLVFLLQGGLLLLGLVLATTAIVLLRSLITQPVTQLLHGVERLAAGDLTAQVDDRSSDEFGSLARSFNEMARKRQAVEQALASSNALLDGLFRTSPLAIVAIDPAGLVDVWNPAAEQLFGFSSEEVMGRPLQIFPESASSDYQEAQTRVFEQGEILRLERPRKRKDGSVFDARIALAPRRRGDERLGTMALIEDVTKERRAAEALRQSELRLANELQIMARLQQITARFVRDDDLKAVLEDIVAAAMEITHADTGTLRLINPDTGRLTIAAQRGFEQPWLDFFNSIDERPIIAGMALERGNRVVIEDLAASPFFAGTPGFAAKLRESGMRAMQSTPLIGTSGALVGLLSTQYRTPTKPAERDLTLLDLLASQVAEMIERSAAEESLQRSEVELKLAQQIAHLGSWVLDLGTSRLTWSDEVYRIFGLVPQEFGATYEAFLEAIHPDDRAAVDEAYRSSIREGRNGYEIEHRIVQRSTGDIRTVHERSEHFRDSTGRIVRSVGTVHDITERKRVAQNLRESEERFRLIIDEAPIGMALLTLDGRFVRVNKALCEITGYSADELTRMTFQAISHPDDVATDVVLLGKLARREIASKRVEKRYLRKGGSWVDVVVNTSVLRSPAGDPLYFIGQIEDITERKHAEAALRQSESRFRELVEQASDSIFIADLDGRFTDVNSSACRMLGYDRDELIGKTIMEIIPPDDVPKLAEAKEYLSQPGRTQIAEWTQLRKDGVPIAVEVSSKILPDGRWQAIVRDIGERKRIEQALRDSEERFRLAIDEAPIGMALVGLDGRFVRVNNALCEIVGYPLDELTALTFQAITHPEDLETDLALLDQLTRGDIPRYQLDKRYIRKDGTVVNIMLSASVLRSRDGAPLYYIAQMEDITERKRAEEAVRLSEEKFSGIISLSTDAIISVDSDQRINLYNQGAESIFGYPQSEAVGKRLDLLLPERLHAIHRAHIDGFAKGAIRSRRMGERMAILGRRKNGEEFPAEASISKLEVGGQRLFTVILRDVTLRERLQKEQRVLAEAGAILTSSLDQQQTLAGLARLVVGDLAELCVVDVTDETGELQRQVVAHADPAKAGPAERLAHLTLDRKRPYLASSVAASKQPLLWAEATPEFLESMAQSAERLEVLRELDPRSGLAVPLLARERFLGVLLFASSNPCRYDQRDLGLAEQLAGRVALALDNSRLYLSAQRATQARDDVLGIVAHDLRNPLASIGLATQVLRHQLGMEAKGIRSVEIIERSVRRSDRLIKDLLDVTRMESGHLSMERRRLAVGQLVYDSVDAQQALASSASLELHLQILQELPDVWADGDRLLQVMENLIGNAVKFTPSGGSITVGAAPRGQEVLLWVADTGPGIPTESLPHVFDRFWQVKRADRQGAGLGLPICKGIIEANGGRIWVESEPGRGSTFYFTVPAWTGSEAQPQPVPEMRH